jgi:hypothetical protein
VLFDFQVTLLHKPAARFRRPQRPQFTAEDKGGIPYFYCQ